MIIACRLILCDVEDMRVFSRFWNITKIKPFFPKKNKSTITKLRDKSGILMFMSNKDTRVFGRFFRLLMKHYYNVALDNMQNFIFNRSFHVHVNHIGWEKENIPVTSYFAADKQN